MTTTPRTGKTLIEMVFVITVIGMVMTIAAKTMATVLNRERSGRDAFTANSERARLASEFRRDVNAAQSASLTDEQDDAGPILKLKLANDTQIEYTLQDHAVTRLRKQDETLLSRDRYRVGFEAARFHIEPGNHELVSFIATITHRPRKASVAQREFRIDGATGKDLRFQAAEETP